MPDWLMPILIGVVIVSLAAAIWRAHELRDAERFSQIWDQIGRDSNSGMRKLVHNAPNLAILVDDLKERVTRLENER